MIIKQAIGLIRDVCAVTIEPDYLTALRTTMADNGIRAAVRRRDSYALLDWLIETVSYQGVSDRLAGQYMDQHGRASSRGVADAFANRPACSLLHSWTAFRGCGYRKTARTCANPDLLATCPLPALDLRNGRLNQIAFGLTLFVRDVCQGDLVGWIDGQLAIATRLDECDGGLQMRSALLEPLGAVEGLSFKVLSMALADLLLGTDPKRHLWVEAGAGMVAIDTLVHNWLARTGILHSLDADHAYGPLCYAPGRCAALIAAAAQQINAQAVCPDGPATFPRLVQHAIWLFCSKSGLDRCNGDQINDRHPCPQLDCPLASRCERMTLQPAQYVNPAEAQDRQKRPGRHH